MTKSQVLKKMMYTDSKGIERYHKKFDKLRHQVQGLSMDDDTLKKVSKQIDLVWAAMGNKKK